MPKTAFFLYKTFIVYEKRVFCALFFFAQKNAFADVVAVVVVVTSRTRATSQAPDWADSRLFFPFFLKRYIFDMHASPPPE